MKLHMSYTPSPLSGHASSLRHSFTPYPDRRLQTRLRALLAIAALLLIAVGALAQSVFPASPLGAAATQAVSVTATAAGTVNTVKVVTVGASGAGLDFVPGGGAATPACAGAVLSVSSVCKVSVTFTPVYPGLRIGAVVLLDAGGDVLGTGYVSGLGQGGLDVLTPGNVITVAGVYRQWSSTTDGIPAVNANLDQPSGVAFDGAGNFYIADSLHNKIRMVCASATSATISGTTCPGAGIIITAVGTGVAGATGDGGLAVNSTLNGPGGVSLDGAGNLYIADTGNNKIRVVNAATGDISTFAGNGTGGFAGDGTLATSAGVELNAPWGVTPDAAGNIYIADTSNQRIRKVAAATGIITTIAGNGNPSGLGDGKGTFSGDGAAANLAGLSLPYTVAFDTSGNMYIPDSANNRVRMVQASGGTTTPASIINTVVGTGGAGLGCQVGTATTSSIVLNSPSGVGLDPAGNVYIADTQDSCIRKANVGTGSTTTIAIAGQPAISQSGNPVGVPLYAPIGLVVDSLGNVFYADYYYMIIEEIQSNKSVLNYVKTPILEGSQSLPQTQMVENDGNAASNLKAVTPDMNAAVDPPTTTCGPPYPFVLAEDADCDIGAIFAPKTVNNPLLANIDVSGDTVNDTNAPLDIVLIGDAVQFNITLTSNPDPSAFGSIVTFTVGVSAASGTATGVVTFTDSLNGAPATPLGTANIVSGNAVLKTAALAVGVHTIVASYGTNSSTATVTQTVYETTKTVVNAVPATPSALGTPVVFTATISGPSGGGQTLSGTVTFTDSAMTFLNNVVTVITNGATGTASYTAAALPQGLNTITATFTPTPTNPQPQLVYPSTGTLNQTVQGGSALTVASAPNPSVFGTVVTFTVAIPTVGPAAAGGKVSVAIVPVAGGAATATLTITLAGNPAAGSATIATLPVGSYNVTANYTGDVNYGAATAALASPQVVTQVQTTTALVAAPNPGIVGKAVAITATVTPASGSLAPTGTVTFTDTFNGATVTLGNAIALNKGVATINPANLAVGTHSIVAAYSGDADEAASSATLSLPVVQGTTATKVTAAPSPAIVQATITFTATVTGNGAAPTGAVNFLANGTINLGTANLNASGVATVTNATLAAGSYQITAVYAGDADNAGSTSPAITEVVGAIPTTTDLGSSATTGANAQLILVATVQNSSGSGTPPTGTVTFTSGTTTVGTATLDASGVATLTPNLTTGSYTIIAAYSGDTLHDPSTSLPITVNGLGSSFTLTAAPATVSLATSQNTTLTVTLTSISGFTDTIGLGCGSLPAGVNCHFSSISVPLAANATATAQLVIDTNNPLGGGASAMNRQPGQRTFERAGLLVPFSLLLGWILWRFRKRHAGVWSMLLVLVLSGAALLATGCNGFTQSSAPAGTFTIQVFGVGAQSNVTQYQNVKLTITQ